jgi:hypothetical protein
MGSPREVGRTLGVDPESSGLINLCEVDRRVCRAVDDPAEPDQSRFAGTSIGDIQIASPDTDCDMPGVAEVPRNVLPKHAVGPGDEYLHSGESSGRLVTPRPIALGA